MKNLVENADTLAPAVLSSGTAESDTRRGPMNGAQARQKQEWGCGSLGAEL